MIIKKFQGKSEAEAVETAKKELGQDIVVMNVRNVKKRGLFSFFRSEIVEITVALEEEEVKAAPASTLPKAAATPKPLTARPLRNPDIIYDDEDPMGSEAQEPKNANLSERLDSLQTLLERQLTKNDEAKAATEEGKDASKEADKEESESYVFMRLLYNKMIDNEIDEKYANQIIDEVDKNSKPNLPFDHLLANIYQKMILKFGKPEMITPVTNGTKIVFFLGPTGVGKTTTIAKIASRFSVDDKKKLALLTADTYRIAAAEQLKTYANILDVPFRIIYTCEEIQKAVEEFRGYDYILVDTAGHSPQNETQRKNIDDFIHSVDDILEKEIYLVLSATTKYRDLLAIADSYRDMADYKLIFTKLDETGTLGNLLNMKLYTGASLSYMTYGQNVPDDIEEFNPQKTVRQLLGGKK